MITTGSIRLSLKVYNMCTSKIKLNIVLNCDHYYTLYSYFIKTIVLNSDLQNTYYMHSRIIKNIHIFKERVTCCITIVLKQNS